MSSESTMKITVLAGGDSPERDVSLKTGEAVATALREAGHQVELVKLDAVRDVLTMPELAKSDVIFPALHGGDGEDGHLQAALDLLGLVYAQSGPVASGMAMDKEAAKRMMRGAGIPTPDWLKICGPEPKDVDIDAMIARVDHELGWPVVLKPNRDGSSVGVKIVDGPSAFESTFREVATMKQPVLIESFIPGRELTATVLMGRRLPLVEIQPRQGFYDFANKYTEGACDYLCPAPVHSPIYEQISGDALRLYDLLGCRGVARVDFRLDGDTYSCLEINTIPGMTATSLVPKAAAVVGIGFGDLLADVCRDALRRRRLCADS